MPQCRYSRFMQLLDLRTDVGRGHHVGPSGNACLGHGAVQVVRQQRDHETGPRRERLQGALVIGFQVLGADAVALSKCVGLFFYLRCCEK